jgi:cytochrome c peroxidase
MSSSTHVRSSVRGILFSLVLIAGPFLPAQEAAPSPALISLGERLFKDARLSSSGSMSCASCHRPDRSFTEDKAQTVGQEGVQLARNTPTLLGLAGVAQYAVGGSMITPPKMVSLEERVLLPLHDVAEMDASPEVSALRLMEDPVARESFADVFDPQRSGGGPEVTAPRLGAALAAFIRSLSIPESPSLHALAGSDVLDESISRGLEVFRNDGRCQSCHSGPGLTDGKLHLVTLRRPPTISSARFAKLLKSNGPVKPAVKSAVLVVDHSPGVSLPETRPTLPVQRRRTGIPGGNYGPMMTMERQTLPLVDVRRTGPYFRDGTVASLSEAVRNHVSDLRQIGAERAEILKKPDLVFRGFRIRATKASLTATSVFSESVREQLASDAWIPADLTNEQMEDLVAFLGALSPGA